MLSPTTASPLGERVIVVRVRDVPPPLTRETGSPSAFWRVSAAASPWPPTSRSMPVVSAAKRASSSCPAWQTTTKSQFSFSSRSCQ